MPTAAVLYATATNATTLTTARVANQVASGSAGPVATTVAKRTGLHELFSQGGNAAAALAATGTSPATIAAQVHGFLVDGTIGEGNSFIGATATNAITPQVKIAASSALISGKVTVRYWRRSSAGVYTLIGSTSEASASAFTTVAATRVLPAITLTETAFGVGDKLYFDVLVDITANTANSNTATISIYELGSGGLQTTFPTNGYQATLLTAISGGGAVASSGARQAAGATLISGGGSLVAAGRRDVGGATSISGGGAVTTTGGRVATGAAAISGGGFVAATGVPVRHGSTLVSGGGTVASSGGIRATGGPTLVTGGGALTVAGAKSTLGSTAISGGGLATDTGGAARHGSTAISGGGSLTAAGVAAGGGAPAYSGSTSVSGGGSVTAVGRSARGSAAGVTGGGSLVAQGRAGRRAAGSIGGGGMILGAFGVTRRFDLGAITGGGFAAALGYRTGGNLVDPGVVDEVRVTAAFAVAGRDAPASSTPGTSGDSGLSVRVGRAVEVSATTGGGD